MSLMRWIREMLHGGVEKTGQAAAEHAARDVSQPVPAASAPAPQPLLKPDDDDLLAENMGDIVPLALEIARLNAPAGSDADVHQNKKEAEINEVSQKSELQPSDSARGAASPVPVSGAAAAQQKKLTDTEQAAPAGGTPDELPPFVQQRIAVSLLKGGVGKSTIVCFLATAVQDLWLRAGVDGRVLVIDTDPQGSAADFFLNGEKVPPELSLRALFEPFQWPADGRLFHSTRYERIDILPSCVEMADVFPDEAGRRERALARYLAQSAGGYRLILIDTPPSDTLSLRCALMASSGIIMPIDPSRQSLKTFSQFARTFGRYRRRNSELKICGVVFSRYDRRLSLDNDIRQSVTELLKNSGIDLYEVPRRAAVAEYFNDYMGYEALDRSREPEAAKVFSDMALKVLSL